MRNRIPFASLVALSLLGGCAPGAAEGDEPAPGADLDVAPDGGAAVSAVTTNGYTLNGIATNGTVLNGIATNGTVVNGVSATGVGVNATVFSGRSITGDHVSGADFVGATMNGQFADGATMKIRIDAMTPLPAPNADLYGYAVSFDGGGGARNYICGLTPGGQPVAALPMMGVWNYAQGVSGGGGFTPSTDRFTFACRGMAIAKCVELGYRPWQALSGGTGTLQNHLVACTRALRADYCGDGRPYTLDGTIINLYDNVGAQADTESWGIEAEWTAAGARFLTTSSNRRYALVGGAPPACASPLQSTSAGSLTHFSTGTLLMNEYLPPGQLGAPPPPFSTHRPRGRGHSTRPLGGLARGFARWAGPHVAFAPFGLARTSPSRAEPGAKVAVARPRRRESCRRPWGPARKGARRARRGRAPVGPGAEGRPSGLARWSPGGAGARVGGAAAAGAWRPEAGKAGGAATGGPGGGEGALRPAAKARRRFQRQRKRARGRAGRGAKGGEARNPFASANSSLLCLRPER